MTYKISVKDCVRVARHKIIPTQEFLLPFKDGNKSELGKALKFFKAGV